MSTTTTTVVMGPPRLPPRHAVSANGRCVGSAFEDFRTERWLALCACGAAHAFLPERPLWKPDDPLRAALGVEAKSRESPPWLRLHRISSGPPWLCDWQHVGTPCDACGSVAVFGVWTFPRPGVRAFSSLCLSCGWVSVTHVRFDGVHETPVAGGEWSPPCVAVARLRRAVFALPGRFYPPTEDEHPWRR